MNLILDQMLDVVVAHALRSMGHNVLRVSDLGMARANDDAILGWAISNNRILITLDSDFGDWAILPLTKHPGVIRIKAKPAHTENVMSALLPFLERYRQDEFANRVAIVSRDKVRWITTGFPV